MKTIADQIRDAENTMMAKGVRQKELMQAASDEGRTLDEAEVEEFDTLGDEVKQLSAHLTRLKQVEALNLEQAQPVVAKTSAQAAQSRTVGAPTVILNREPDEKFIGQNFTRLAIAKALAFHGQTTPTAVAHQRWGKTNPRLVEFIRANEVSGGGTGSGEWGSELVSTDNRYTGDFIEYLYGQTVYNRLGLREVPANVTIKGQDGAATAYWTGESAAIPVTAMDFMDVELTSLEVDTIAVVSNKLLRESSPSAEMLIRDSIVQAAVKRVDQTFCSTSAAVAGVSPAGMLNGVSPFSSSGTDEEGLRQDVYKLYQPFLNAYNATGLKFVCNPNMAKAISLMVNALGQTSFPGISTAGGVLLGDEVVTGDHVTATHLILCKPSDIWRIGDMGVNVSMTNQAAIEMNSAPAGNSQTPTASSNNLVSMFQTNSTAFKVTMPISFAKRRSHAVQYITGASYGALVSP